MANDGNWQKVKLAEGRRVDSLERVAIDYLSSSNVTIEQNRNQSAGFMPQCSISLTSSVTH